MVTSFLDAASSFQFYIAGLVIKSKKNDVARNAALPVSLVENDDTAEEKRKTFTSVVNRNVKCLERWSEHLENDYSEYEHYMSFPRKFSMKKVKGTVNTYDNCNIT